MKAKYPTIAQHRVLAVLDRGGHFEKGTCPPRLIGAHDGPREVRYDTYWVLLDRGWIESHISGATWTISDAGRDILHTRRIA